MITLTNIYFKTWVPECPNHRRRDYSSADSKAVCPSSQLAFLLSTPKFWSCFLFLTDMIVREGVSLSYYHRSCQSAECFQQWLLVILCTYSSVLMTPPPLQLPFAMEFPRWLTAVGHFSDTHSISKSLGCWSPHTHSSTQCPNFYCHTCAATVAIMSTKIFTGTWCGPWLHWDLLWAFQFSLMHHICASIDPGPMMFLIRTSAPG